MRTVPCTGLDLFSHTSVMTAGFIVDARLDAKLLEVTLSTLIERKFPSAGARLALRNGVYEFQVPRTFDAHTPPVAFTADDYPECYRSSARPELPTELLRSAPDTQPVIRELPELDVYFKSRQCPTSLAEFLVPNTPLFHVHVAAFDDLTFVGLTWSHAIFDLMGLQTLLNAWTRLLNGEKIETIPGMDWNMAPFRTFTASTAVAPQRGWYDLGLLGRLSFIVRHLLRLWWDPKETTYLMRVPKKFLDGSKREIMDNLKLRGSTEWVGSSDVLAAWWFKTAYSHRQDKTPIHIHIAADVRDKPVFPGASSLATPYIHNAVLMLHVPPIPANAFHTLSLADLALRIRRAIIAFNEAPDGIVADLHCRCSNPLKVLFPSPAGGEHAFQSSWRKARLAAVDFSGACVGKNGARPRVACLGFTRNNVPLRGIGVLLMEDEEDVWMSQTEGEKVWANVRRSGKVAVQDERPNSVN
ncbi:hypothetical protein B0H19DRAFT_929392 [Mycena capillaripes]|nr:hypothetical protein B0H19DRAFT_929392 [Mycena capillaripes]